MQAEHNSSLASTVVRHATCTDQLLQQHSLRVSLQQFTSGCMLSPYDSTFALPADIDLVEILRPQYLQALRKLNVTRFVYTKDTVSNAALVAFLVACITILIEQHPKQSTV